MIYYVYGTVYGTHKREVLQRREFKANTKMITSSGCI